MLDWTIFLSWAEFGVRWLHVITAIAWIGSSFYFIALDLGLRRDRDLGDADGEEWQVHGGGFYHVRKFMVAPKEMPEHLTWFKWESYSTWLSGAALMILVYYAGAELYLVDLNKADLGIWQAILISAASLTVGWLAYDFLCKSPLGERPSVLMLLLFALLVVMGWAYNQIFTGRAMMLHLGAFTATIMTANVFLIIMPNQRVVVGDLKAGRTPDAKYGKIAKLRSTHNNYLTLPVIFLMLSNHYPLAFATEWNWIIAALVFLMGVTIRHYFNSLHARKGNPHWTWAVTTVLFLLIVWLSTGPRLEMRADAAAISPKAEALIASDGFDRVYDIVLGRCSMCHAEEPNWDGMFWPPKGVILETEAHIARFAGQIYLHSAVSHAMPPANVSWMEQEERDLIANWYRGAVYDE